MSRGLGGLQRRILHRLAVGGDPHLPESWTSRGYVSSYTLASSICEGEPTRSERVSIQRALRNLEARGLVDLINDRCRGSSRGLWARLPATDARRDWERAEAAKLHKNIVEALRGSG